MDERFPLGRLDASTLRTLLQKERAHRVERQQDPAAVCQQLLLAPPAAPSPLVACPPPTTEVSPPVARDLNSNPLLQ